MLGTLLVSMAHAAAEVCDDVHGLHTRDHTGLHGTKPETTQKSMISPPADCNGQGSHFYRDIYGCRLTVEKEGHKRLL